MTNYLSPGIAWCSGIVNRYDILLNLALFPIFNLIIPSTDTRDQKLCKSADFAFFSVEQYF